MVSLFKWNNSFLTGIESVDEQHQKLVSLINELGEQVMSTRGINKEVIENICDGIINYTTYHFKDEEIVMDQYNLDPRYIKMHKNIHNVFLNGVKELTQNKHNMDNEDIQRLAEFLINWLAFHILEIDQSMARQIKAIKNGETPQKSYEDDIKLIHNNSEPLITAMSGLFYIVSERNRALKQLNADLEDKVHQRTLELEKANEQLKTLATQDVLTGLPNRRFAILTITQLLHSFERYGTKFSLFIIDADHFKQVNDTYGHVQGDIVLQTLSNNLKSSVRKSDVVCRLGGDEFLVILSNTDYDCAKVVAKKILLNSTAVYCKENIECWSGSISLGIAEVDETIITPESFIEKADLALYESKRKGGNSIS